MTWTSRRSSTERWAALLASYLVALAPGCTEIGDAGYDSPHGPVPVDERSAIVISNDGAYDNWLGEQAILFSQAAGPKIAAITVNATKNYPDLPTNIEGWRALVAAARASGLQDVPDPISSVGNPLVRPASGDIDSTRSNGSEGARAILEASRRLSFPSRPLAVLTGGSLTDVADAYLLDQTVTDRVVVVSKLGSCSGSGGAMTAPNGELDPWADTIVAARFRYVQICPSYDQTQDVPDARLAELPANAFGSWISTKRPMVTGPLASDQATIAAVALGGFVVEPVGRASSAGPVAAGATLGPNLVADPNGSTWLVSQVQGTVATARFQQLLFDPSTYRP